MANVQQMYASFKKMVENGHGDVEVYTSDDQSGTCDVGLPMMTMNVPEHYDCGPLQEEVAGGTMVCLIHINY